jgi:hypothetical protein
MIIDTIRNAYPCGVGIMHGVVGQLGFWVHLKYAHDVVTHNYVTLREFVCLYQWSFFTTYGFPNQQRNGSIQILGF